LIPGAFTRLVAAITKANELYKPSTPDKERQAETAKVLDRIELFLWQIGLRSPHLVGLLRALEDVRDGHEHPLFKPHRTSRPRENSRGRHIKGVSAAAMDTLMKNGFAKWDAAKAVAKVLTENSFRLTRGGKIVTCKTVAAWRDRFIGHVNDPAASDYDWALRIIECRGPAFRDLRTSDPKINKQRALYMVKKAI
jgi:hypothetical protein